MRKPKLEQLDALTRAYIEAMAWTEQPESKQYSGEFILDRYYYSRIDGKLVAKCVEDCKKFQMLHSKLIEEGGSKFGDAYEQAGHDFWLTRNRHGSGFWDGDWPEPYGDKLTEASKKFGGRDVYWHKGRLYSY